MFNQICINEEMLSKYTLTHTKQKHYIITRFCIWELNQNFLI